ncbi:P-loop containing nucleoside triphosphate hydrolase protein [Macrolepiota fuliginosa MF-IS2]|uniref:P-loop containing nucleoside triphosphate hydrolase protein n=1 Tax=Macrolepiota fuliginosa MF-IS2 TaxID=1400762 RepID=A0A9P5XNG4_9AGAR|nr:P-loop containing nucleoside triphosphate hydrolase protein [Macrolepiota fuliginosa MF-IS2]
MAKKRTIVEDEETPSAPGSPVAVNKRARTGSTGNEKGTSRNRNKGKAKAKATDHERMDEDEDEDDDEGENEETPEETENQEELDKQFEAQHYDEIMASVKSRDKYSGTIAEYGIIEKVELYQFMCHQRLTFSFGPQINFIIGHNGSGKSAVLSAITIALGGKTASTGRGSGLKAFIREGQSAAEVSIQLKNKGDEAYRHKDFGDSIIINRRFTTEGSSTWKIKSKDGKVLSTKREELSKICDHMNIQVDNPMTVLTQGNCSSLRVDTYLSDLALFRCFARVSGIVKSSRKLFLKGTQLQQLSDEYSITLENIQSTDKVLDQKREAIPDLRVALQDAKRRFDEAENARKQKVKQDDLKKEMAWAHVKAKENELLERLTEVATHESKVPKIQAGIDAEKVNIPSSLIDAHLTRRFKAKLAAITEEIAAQENALTELGDIDDLEGRKLEIRNKIKANKTKLGQRNAEIKAMDAEMKGLRKTVAELDEQIEKETQRLEKNTQAKREQIQNQLTAKQAQVTTHEATIASLRDQKQELLKRKENAEQQGRQLEEKQKDLQDQIKYQEGMIRNCEQAEKDNLLPYGRNIKAVLEQINQMRWHGNTPLGPLGAYVKAKEPRIWGDILRSQLAQYLTSFAITDPRDRNQLKDLFSRSQNHHVQIIISSTELFDYSEGEPPPAYLTVLRALEIANPLVTRILINSANVESRVLAKTRLEAQRSLEQLPRGGMAYTLDQFIVRVFPDGISSIPLELRRSNDSSNLMLTGRDTANEIGQARQAIASLQQQIEEIKPDIQKFRKEFGDCVRQVSDLSQSEIRENSSLRMVHAECQRLSRELNEEMPTNINGFADEKREREAEMGSIGTQFESLLQDKKIIDNEQQQLLSEQTKLRKRIDVFAEKRNGLKSDLEQIVENRIRAQTSVSHYEKRLQEAQQKIEQEKQSADILQREFVAWTEKASQYCEQVPNPRSLPELKQLLESVGRALKEREKRQGASIEDLEDQLLKAKEQYQNARSNIRAMLQLNKKLRSSLVLRFARWENFRRHIALRTKVVFQYHLSQRGYFGKLLFDHGAKMLVLKVQTDDQASQAGHKEKDPRSLSGGEKSFSTICLLLALWESIGCPIRCLDEFDVFMDAVNRRISMKMMIDTANASNQKQYVLITPLEMANISFGNTVRVHKMSDPQRNQGTLAFSS